MDVADEAGRDLRRLAKKFGITFKPPNPDEWPPTHSNTFGAIRAIRDQKFDTYCTDSSISSEQPWRGQTKRRAEWLAKRAASLLNQRRNEAGWRFAIENDVLRRFHVEVACPKCRARIWRSEFEAYVDPSEDTASHLQQRRTNRMPCTCSQEYRAYDSYYDVGTNPLFEDRVEEVIMHDPLVQSHLPKQRPDRVYGLRQTKAFESALDALISSTRAMGDRRFGNTVTRCSPFKDQDDPLLFPFLILEAKAEKSSNGFDEIQTQTAFPIWALLNLQESMQARVSEGTPNNGPLVWFIANRGDYWRVYGCYVTGDDPVKYDIVQLWDGCITDKDSSLQLLLVVDYIVDWARDVYRPSILRQLKSSATGIAYDEVSLSSDSDVYSTMRRISDWIPGPPTIADDLELRQDIISDSLPIRHEDMLPISIPNTERGSLRSASIFDSRIFGIRLTEDNTKAALRLAGGLAREEEKSQKAARDILNFLSRWDELIAVSEADLDYLEDTWTGDVSAGNRASTTSPTTTFYVLVEFATFMTNTDTWNIAKEVSYVAVSEPALEILIAKADFKKPPPGLKALPRKVRQCSDVIWRATVECLRLGSPWQHFSAAVSCVSFSLYSLPERKREDNATQTEALGFGFTKRLRLQEIIKKFHKFSKKRLAPKPGKSPPRPDQAGSSPEPIKRDVIPRPEEITFVRVSQRRQYTSQRQEHADHLCDRCRTMNAQFKDAHGFRRTDKPLISGYGMALVEALDLTSSREDKHDLCLFAFDMAAEITDTVALAIVVEDLLQSSHMYHTIRHPLPPSFSRRDVLWNDTLWNLPSRYRPVTKKQRLDARHWVLELRGQPIPAVVRDHSMNYWNNLQFLMHFLKQGIQWRDACVLVKTVQIETKHRRDFYHRLTREEEEKMQGKELKPGFSWSVNMLGESFVASTIPWIGPPLSVKGELTPYV